jgi:hypothetical protein
VETALSRQLQTLSREAIAHTEGQPQVVANKTNPAVAVRIVESEHFVVRMDWEEEDYVHMDSAQVVDRTPPGQEVDRTLPGQEAGRVVDRSREGVHTESLQSWSVRKETWRVVVVMLDHRGLLLLVLGHMRAEKLMVEFVHMKVFPRYGCPKLTSEREWERWPDMHIQTVGELYPPAVQ